MAKREMLELAAKLAAADPDELARAIEEMIESKRTLDGIGEGSFYTPDYMFASGGFLERIMREVRPTEKVRGKNLRMSEDLTMQVFRCAEFDKYVGMRMAKDGNPPRVFEIVCDRRPDCAGEYGATISSNGEELVRMYVAMGRRNVGLIALSVLRALVNCKAKSNEHMRQLRTKKRQSKAEAKKRGGDAK